MPRATNAGVRLTVGFVTTDLHEIAADTFVNPVRAFSQHYSRTNATETGNLEMRIQ